jgi:hypothetical protein
MDIEDNESDNIYKAASFIIGMAASLVVMYLLNL